MDWLRLAVGLLALGSLASCSLFQSSDPVSLRIGTTGDYAPFTINERDQLSGLDIDTMNQLSKDLHFRPTYVLFSWPMLATKVKERAFDVGASGITMRPDRALIGRYSRPYAIVGTVVLVRKTEKAAYTDINTLNDPGAIIAVNAGGHLEHVARWRFPLATIVPVANNEEVPRKVLDGAADAAVTDTAEASHWMTPELWMLGPFTRDYKAFLYPIDAEQPSPLPVQVDTWMVAHESDGWLPKARGRWLGENFELNADDMTRESVAALINLRLSLMPWVGAAKVAAHMRIDDVEQEEKVITRVRKASTDPNRIEAIYRVLIELSKIIQRQAQDAKAVATLTELRDAIVRIDEQLVRELDRIPPTSAEGWMLILDRTLTVRGVDPTIMTFLTSALAERPST